MSLPLFRSSKSHLDFYKSILTYSFAPPPWCTSIPLPERTLCKTNTAMSFSYLKHYMNTIHDHRPTKSEPQRVGLREGILIHFFVYSSNWPLWYPIEWSQALALHTTSCICSNLSPPLRHGQELSGQTKPCILHAATYIVPSKILHVLEADHPHPLFGKFLLTFKSQLKDQPFLEHFPGCLSIVIQSKSTKDFISITTIS